MKKLILTFSFLVLLFGTLQASVSICLLYTSDAADE